ncbi:phage tail fiber protein [Scandinavium goeteborgense]|uniref:phage tail fiber protein n=1 Tax=Scandinavium goeteborgense TaxID=1851514 RepID=UPI000F668069|nr:hypothetical protein [Scandinavium goeteborgense]QKN82064.1 hypothetical protein A8O29_012495 [Scandinavium goeteborgense]
MQDISGFGLQVRVIASKTFPAGFTVTAFADDSDPLDLPALQINDGAGGLNGDMVTWSTHNLIALALAVIPKSEDDKNLAVIYEANRAARGKKPAKDVITIVGIYPDGSTITLTPGVIKDGLPGNAVASAGRFKSKVYNFLFEGMSRVEA